MSEFNRTEFLWKSTIKVILFCAAVYGLFYSAKIGWDEFRGWAVHRKVNNLTTRAVNGICGKDTACQDWMAQAQIGCVSWVIDKRAEPFAPEVSPMDKRRLKSCLQKSMTQYHCGGESKCLARVQLRYNQCYDYAYPPKATKNYDWSASALTACLQGYQIVKGDADGGTSMEVVSIEKAKRDMAIQIAKERSAERKDGGLEGLKEELRGAGEERRENFDDATALLNESRGEGEEEGLISVGGEATLESVRRENADAAKAQEPAPAAAAPAGQ